MKTFTLSFLAFVLALALSACGGGGGGSSSTSSAAAVTGVATPSSVAVVTAK